MICKHEETYYYPSINEDGWECINCKKKIGFSPKLDRERLCLKIRGIMDDLHDKNFIRFSNGTMGDIVMENVEGLCLKEQRFDQYFILKCIIDDPNVDVMGHSDFWKREITK